MKELLSIVKELKAKKNTENGRLLAVKAQNCGFLRRFPEQLFNVCVQEIVVNVWLETSKVQVFTTPALKLPKNLHNSLVLNLNSKPKFKDSRNSPDPLTPFSETHIQFYRDALLCGGVV